MNFPGVVWRSNLLTASWNKYSVCCPGVIGVYSELESLRNPSGMSDLTEYPPTESSNCSSVFVLQGFYFQKRTYD